MRRAAHPPGCAWCGAGAVCSAMKCQPLLTLLGARAAERTHGAVLRCAGGPSGGGGAADCGGRGQGRAKLGPSMTIPPCPSVPTSVLREVLRF